MMTNPTKTHAYRLATLIVATLWLLQSPSHADEKFVKQVDLFEEPLSEVATYLSKTSASLNGGKARNVLLDPKVDPKIQINLSLRNVPLNIILGYVAEVSGLDYRVDRHAIVFIPRKEANAHSLGSLRRMSVFVAQRLQKTKLDVDFHDEPLRDVAAFLSKRSLELDPEKKGINFVFSKGVDPSTPVTLKLSDVPLVSVLKYITESTDLRTRVDSHAVVFLTSKK